MLPKLTVLCLYTMYPLVRTVCKRDFKMRIIEEDNQEDFDLMWCDHAIPIE